MSEENGNQSRAIIDGGITPGQGRTIRVYNNRGTKLLCEYVTNGVITLEVTSTGLNAAHNNEVVYTYSSDGIFLGVSTTANATTPNYAIGASYTMSSTLPNDILFIVSKEYDKVNRRLSVEYDGRGFTVTKGSPLTLNCKDKIMKSNVTLTKL